VHNLLQLLRRKSDTEWSLVWTSVQQVDKGNSRLFFWINFAQRYTARDFLALNSNGYPTRRFLEDFCLVLFVIEFGLLLGRHGAFGAGVRNTICGEDAAVRSPASRQEAPSAAAEGVHTEGKAARKGGKSNGETRKAGQHRHQCNNKCQEWATQAVAVCRWSLNDGGSIAEQYQ